METTKESLEPSWCLLRSTADEPVRIASEWVTSFRKRHGFKCGHFDYSLHPSPIPVVLPAKYASYGFTSPLVFVTIANDLLELLRSDFDANITIGALVAESSDASLEHSSISSTSRVQLRGSPRSYCWKCRICGQLIYSTLGNSYILKRDLPQRKIFLSSHGLVLPKRLADSLRGKRFRHVKIEHLAAR